mmetsp:Transcript_3170/g.7121  ORF Transcript_3170/g.7121 Transcript_3170/m.7121 type:complete len:80 (+) Transcript_3170:35-274(+)
MPLLQDKLEIEEDRPHVTDNFSRRQSSSLPATEMSSQPTFAFTNPSGVNLEARTKRANSEPIYQKSSILQSIHQSIHHN